MQTQNSPNSQPLPLNGVPARPLVYRAGARGLRPDPELRVSEWAEKHRHVAREASPYPGPWRNARVPFAVEVMDCLSPTASHLRVTLMKAVQISGSEIIFNWLGSIIDAAPGPTLVVHPTVEAGKDWVQEKFDPNVEATPRLKDKVSEPNEKDGKASTSKRKRFAGGDIVVTGANSSRALRQKSRRFLAKDDWDDWPLDVSGQGDPDKMAEARLVSFLRSGTAKILQVSTPTRKQTSRINRAFEAGDQRRYYVPCPHCGTFQRLVFGDKDSPAGLKFSLKAPHRAEYLCGAPGCGGLLIAHVFKDQMLARGVWLKCYPRDGETDIGPPPEYVGAAEVARWRARSSGARDPSFQISALYSPFTTWDHVAAAFVESQGDPALRMTFVNLWLGEAYEEQVDVPQAERLYELRKSYGWQRVPPGALFLTAMADVQGNRIEYGVYAWSARLTHGWYIDGDVIMGDPAGPEPWRALDAAINRTYADQHGKPWDIDAFGIDTGYLAHHVYRFCMDRFQPLDRNTRKVFALDGRDGWDKPAIGTATVRDVDFEGKKLGAVRLFPLGTYPMKREHYLALNQTLLGPNPATGEWPALSMHFHENCSREFFGQLTAEYVQEVRNRSGVPDLIWVLGKNRRNEQLDIAVGARALAHHIGDSLTVQQWADLAARRGDEPEKAQGDLARLWAPGLAGSPSQKPNEANDVRRTEPPRAPVRRTVRSPYIR